MRVTPTSMSFADVSSRSRTVNHTGKPTMDTRATRGWSERVRVCVHGSTGWPLPYVIRADAKQRFEIALRDPAATVIAISAPTGDFARVRYSARPRSREDI